MAPMHRLVGVLYNKNMGFHDKVDFTAPITLCFIASKGHTAVIHLCDVARIL